MNTRKENRTAFILSFLLHLLLLLLFFFVAFKQKNMLLLDQKQSIKQRDMAALLPKKSDSGTQVIFDDSVILPIETFETPASSETEPQKDKKAEPPVEEPASQKKEIDPIQEKPSPPTAEPLPIQDPDNNNFTATKSKTVPFQGPIPAIEALEDPHEIDPPKQAKHKKAPIKEVPQKQEQKPQFSHEELQKRIAEVTQLALANLVKSNRAKAKKPKEESLATCYVDHEQGNSCLIRNGSNRFPELEEMKYICYEKQIEDHIISSWKAKYGFSNHPQRGANGKSSHKASITFLINQNGSISGLSLLESSGNSSFDSMVLDCIKNTTFPPIPKHFGVKQYRPRSGYTLLPSY